MAKRSFARKTVKGKKVTIFIILVVLLASIAVTLFGVDLPFNDKDGNQIRIKGIKELRYGIDIRGGVEAVYVAKDYEGTPTEEQMNAAAAVLNKRLDDLQILDREVVPGKNNGRIIVRFPWKSNETNFNPDEAIKELGETANLTFSGPDGVTFLDGSMVDQARAVFNQQTQEPMVELNFKPEGRQALKEATTKFLQQTMTIKLDQTVISTATIRAVLDQGSGVIEGHFSREEAVSLAQKINAGALPFALEAINSRTISPKLGSDSLFVMSTAGAIAFIVICIFMLLYYRLPGLVACLSLTMQVIGILLGISIPQQTLTLQGIAAIILSIGMGVDANIIISARIREEANKGQALPTFLYNGFTKAFSSVMDSNVTVAIAAIILMLFGSGTILSFGYSLLLGVILNGITGVWLTRLMISSLSAYKPLQNPWLYGAKKQAVAAEEAK